MPGGDCQSFFKVSTQILSAEETFGWKILVANQLNLSLTCLHGEAMEVTDIPVVQQEIRS